MSAGCGEYGRWILQGPNEKTRPPDAPPVRLRLFCVPQAGCGAWSFHGWSRHLPPDVEVMPVELPAGSRSRAFSPITEFVITIILLFKPPSLIVYVSP